jgi:predicted helicase
VADGLPDGHTVSSKETNHVYPLYVYVPGENALRENIAPEFRRWIEERFTLPLTPEELISYVYAVLHAGSYRALYSDFLLIDAPRLPFPESADDFEVLSGLGWALVQAHLLRELPRRRLAAYHGKGGHTVEALHYSPEQQAVAINRTQFFKPVPQAVWDSTSAAIRCSTNI